MQNNDAPFVSTPLIPESSPTPLTPFKRISPIPRIHQVPSFPKSQTPSTKAPAPAIKAISIPNFKTPNLRSSTKKFSLTSNLKIQSPLTKSLLEKVRENPTKILTSISSPPATTPNPKDRESYSKEIPTPITPLSKFDISRLKATNLPGMPNTPSVRIPNFQRNSVNLPSLKKQNVASQKLVYNYIRTPTAPKIKCDLPKSNIQHKLPPLPKNQSETDNFVTPQQKTLIQNQCNLAQMSVSTASPLRNNRNDNNQLNFKTPLPAGNENFSPTASFSTPRTPKSANDEDSNWGSFGFHIGTPKEGNGSLFSFESSGANEEGVFGFNFGSQDTQGIFYWICRKNKLIFVI